jgi:capsular polysaccharide biosynthesis protein
LATVTKKNTRQAIVSQKDINLVLRIIKSNWWIPLIIVPIFYAIGNFYVYRLTDIYQASTEFLLKNNDVFDEKSVLTGDNFYSAGNTFVDNTNQIRIIKSYDMADKIVDKLWQKLQVSYYIVGKVRTTEIFNELPFSIDVNAASSLISGQIIDFKIIIILRLLAGRFRHIG